MLDKTYAEQVQQNIEGLKKDQELKEKGLDWLLNTAVHRYSYNFSWLGVPIIQFPQDIMAMQELIWKIKPDLIIETGVAHGGSLLFYASMLELVGADAEVLGIDIDIRDHAYENLNRSPLKKRIQTLQGSSIDSNILDQVRQYAGNKERVLVALDSNHSHDHVLKELELYSRFVDKGSYIVVFDSIIENMPEGYFQDRPWNKKSNPKTAVREFLEKDDRFVVDEDLESKLGVTFCPEGYLKCVKAKP